MFLDDVCFHWRTITNKVEYRETPFERSRYKKAAILNCYGVAKGSCHFFLHLHHLFGNYLQLLRIETHIVFAVYYVNNMTYAALK